MVLLFGGGGGGVPGRWCSWWCSWWVVFLVVFLVGDVLSGVPVRVAKTAASRRRGIEITIFWFLKLVLQYAYSALFVQCEMALRTLSYLIIRVFISVPSN